MLQARPHLFCAWRSEDSAGDASSEETIAYETSESGLMSRTTAANHGNIMRLRERRGVTIDNLVRFVEQKRWIGKSKRLERGKDGIGGISEVVLCCWGGEVLAQGHWER